MTEVGGPSIKSLRYLIASPTGALSGNLPLTFNAIPVTGRIIGVEVGSAAFTTATGSMYVIASGATHAQNRTIATINGVAQTRTYYPITQFQRSSSQGTLLSGLAWSAMEYPLIDGDQIGIAGSGLFGGSALIMVYYQ